VKKQHPLVFDSLVDLDTDGTTVTGSAHCYLAPYWGKKLGKTVLVGYRASQRPGTVLCELTDRMRVLLKGRARTVIQGELIF
jgi:predicted PhzF superfamily epimerase YddE/YHI9